MITTWTEQSGVFAFSAESLAASCASCKRLESSPASAECLSCTAVYCQSQSKTIWTYVAVKAGHVRLFILIILYTVARDRGKSACILNRFDLGILQLLLFLLQALLENLKASGNCWKTKFAFNASLVALSAYQVVGAVLRRSSSLLLWTDASKL